MRTTPLGLAVVFHARAPWHIVQRRGNLVGVGSVGARTWSHPNWCGDAHGFMSSSPADLRASLSLGVRWMLKRFGVGYSYRRLTWAPTSKSFPLCFSCRGNARLDGTGTGTKLAQIIDRIDQVGQRWLASPRIGPFHANFGDFVVERGRLGCGIAPIRIRPSIAPVQHNLLRPPLARFRQNSARTRQPNLVRVRQSSDRCRSIWGRPRSSSA